MGEVISCNSPHRSLFASHSLSLGHFFFARLSIQSPQIVISGLHGTKPSGLFVVDALFIFALRALSMLVTFDIMQIHSMKQGPPRRF